MFFVLRNPSLQTTWLLQRSVTVVSVSHLFQLGIFLFLNFSFLFNLDLVFSCFLGKLQFLFCYHALMTFSILVSRHRSNFFLRDLVRLGLHLALLFLFLACCWLCSSVTLVQLSEILVDLLVVVVQVLRLCAPSRQSGFASFVDFFSPTLCLLASPPPALPCGSLLPRGSPPAPPMPQLSIAPLRGHWFAVSAGAPQCRSLQQRGLLFVRSGFTPSSLVESLPPRFVGGLQRHCVVLWAVSTL